MWSTRSAQLGLSSRASSMVMSPQSQRVSRRLGRANEGVLGKAVLKDKNGVVLAQVAPMFVPGSGFLFTLFDFPVPVGTSATTEGTLTVEADNPSGLPQNDFRVTVPLTFGRTLLGAPN